MNNQDKFYTELPKELSFDPDQEGTMFDRLKFIKDEQIFKEGTYSSGLYFINKGKVKIHKFSPDGKDKILHLMKAGDFIGYKDLLSGTPFTNTATAFENTTIYFIPKARFGEIMKKKEISDYFMKLMSFELSNTENEILNLSYKPVKGRLIETLLSLNTDNPESSAINLSREELASFVGSATETIIRLLSELKKLKLIEIHGRLISVINPTGLMKINNLYNY